MRNQLLHNLHSLPRCRANIMSFLSLIAVGRVCSNVTSCFVIFCLNSKSDLKRFEEILLRLPLRLFQVVFHQLSLISGFNDQFRKQFFKFLNHFHKDSFRYYVANFISRADQKKFTNKCHHLRYHHKSLWWWDFSQNQTHKIKFLRFPKQIDDEIFEQTLNHYSLDAPCKKCKKSFFSLSARTLPSFLISWKILCSICSTSISTRGYFASWKPSGLNLSELAFNFLIKLIFLKGAMDAEIPILTLPLFRLSVLCCRWWPIKTLPPTDNKHLSRIN